MSDEREQQGEEPGAHGREGSNPSDRTTVAPRGRNFSRPEDRKSRSGAAQRSSRRRAHGHDAGEISQPEEER